MSKNGLQNTMNWFWELAYTEPEFDGYIELSDVWIAISDLIYL